MGNILRKRLFLITLCMILGYTFLCTSAAVAQKMTHTVQKGDTLWDICEMYYGDADLWPKLWQMNPFVTNPHLLDPGDVITLFDRKMIDELGLSMKTLEPSIPTGSTDVEISIVEPETEQTTEVEPSAIGVDLKGIIDIDTIGHLSLTEPSVMGRIFASENANYILTTGDTAYAIFDKGVVVNPGDELSACKISKQLEHPITGKDLGYTVSTLGKIVVQEPAGLTVKRGEFFNKENVYKVYISLAYRPIHLNDPIMQFQEVSPCVLPVSMNKEWLDNIVTTKDQHELVGQYSIVYLDKGYNQGIQKGNLFDIVKINIVDDPEDETVFKGKGTLILPDISVGCLMVLDSRPDTSTAIVLSAKEVMYNGIYIKGLSWIEPPDIIKTLARCPLE
jgi:hypothetical protein